MRGPVVLPVVLLEDDPAYAAVVERMLATGCPQARLSAFERLQDACRHLQGTPAAVVLADLTLPDAQGTAVVTALREAAGDAPIVVLSGDADEEVALQALRAGAVDFLLKAGTDADGLARTVRHAVERAAAHAAVATGERRTREILDGALDAHVAIDARGRITQWNPAAEEMFGWPAREVLGTVMAERIIPVALRGHHRQGLQRFLRTGVGVMVGRRVEIRARRRDGSEFPAEMAITAGDGDDGVWFSAFIQDISERDAAQRALRRSEELLRTAVAHLPGTVIRVFDGDLRLVKASGDTTGRGPWPRVEEVGSTAWPSARDGSADLAAMVRVALEGGDHACDLDGDGGLLFATETVPVLDEVGSVVAALMVARDVTDRRRMERFVAAQHAATEVLASSPPVEQAIPRILAAVGGTLGWEVGALWLRDEGDDALRCDAFWHDGGLDTAAFEGQTRALRLPLGDGLPGRAWLTGRPIWVEDLAVVPYFRRPETARALGLRSAVAVPVRSGGTVVGALEFFSRGRLDSDAQRLEPLTALGVQLGDFLERKRAEAELARYTAHVATVAEATRMMARATDPATVRRTITEATRAVTASSAAFIAEPDADGGLLVHAPAGLRELELRLPPEPEPCAMAIVRLTGTRLFLPDADANPTVPEALRAATGCRSALFEPVVVDGACVAVLCVVWTELLEQLPERLATTMSLLGAEVAATLSRANLVARLDAAARTDELTGLPNRRHWDEGLQTELGRSRRSGRPVAVAMFDLDHFKAYNDAHGHGGGDQLLQRAAVAWSSKLRVGDLLARIGGEEFALLLEDCALPDAARRVEALRASTPSVTCSAGLVQWDGVEPPHVLLCRADVALYRAKAEGRDRIVVAVEPPEGVQSP